MKFERTIVISENIIQLFNNHKYETKLLEMMQLSRKVFPGNYSHISSQSNGECDFIDESGNKFDAKVAFLKNEMKLITFGKKYAPEITEWLKLQAHEREEFDFEIVNGDESRIKEAQLYSVMKDEIVADSNDESIVFFFPFPMGSDYSGSIFLQFASDNLDIIYGSLKNEIDLNNRYIYAIYPGDSRNTFVLRNLSLNNKEIVYYDGLADYFIYEDITVCTEYE